MKHAVIALGVAMGGACAEPVVEIELTGLNPGNLNTSCASAVNMYVYGETYETDKNDLIFDCKVITSKSSAAEVKAAMTNLFDVQIPRSGLLGVEIEAHSGGCPSTENQIGADLVFNASARYDGGGRLDLPLEPIASCDSATITTRAIDVLKLIASPTHDCNAALLGDGLGAEVFLGELAPSLVDGTFWWSTGNAQTAWTNGAGTNKGLYSVGKAGCFAAYIGTSTVYSKSCVDPDPMTPRVCTPAGELEVGVIPVEAVKKSLDQGKLGKWKGVVIGSVWTGTTARTPATGVTVEIDTDHGEVVYVEPQPNNSLAPIANATATGASGMFVLFTDRVQEVTVKDGRTERKVRMGADKVEPAVSLIQL